MKYTLKEMEFFKNLLHNCEETSFNIVKAEEGSLEFYDWLKMKFHITFCKCCRNFKTQTQVMDKAIHHHFQTANQEEQEKAPQELKDKLKEILKEK